MGHYIVLGSALAESALAESEVAESEVAESEVAESEVAGSEVAESEVAESARGDKVPSQIKLIFFSMRKKKSILLNHDRDPEIYYWISHLHHLFDGCGIG